MIKKTMSNGFDIGTLKIGNYLNFVNCYLELLNEHSCCKLFFLTNGRTGNL